MSSSLAERVTLAFAEWQASERSWHDPVARAVQISTAVAFGITGAVFYIKPNDSAEFLGLRAQNENGIVEVKAFYGTMELFLGVALGFVRCSSSLAITSAMLLGAASGRLINAGRNIPSSIASEKPQSIQELVTIKGLLHPQIALAEICGSIFCLWAHLREAKAKAKQDAAAANLVRRQGPDPQRLADFVPYSSENLQDPYPWYKALRDEAPVHKPLGLDYYLVSRAEDIQQVCKDTETFSSRLVAILFQGPGGRQSSLDVQGMDAFTGGVVDVLALQDAPIHTIHRKCAFNGLSPKLFAAMGDKIRERAKQMLEEGFRGKSCVDWMDHMAFRLPMVVALEVCGFPSDPATARTVKAQADHGVALMSGTNTPEEFASHAMEARTLFKWIQKQFSMIRQSPKEARTDFANSLITGVESGDLSLSEAESIILQILLAGNDSSASTMGSAIKVLCERPDIQAKIREDPAKLIPVFIEEVLRYESPFGGHFRLVRKDTELSGVKLRKGERVMVLWASGNRDERYWENPEEFLLTRGAKGKTHFSFGNGVHLCLGNTLARREVRIVIEELLAMFPSVKRAEKGPKPYYIPSSFARSLARYHVDLR